MPSVINRNAPESVVARTKCDRCGIEGYIFPDQLKRGEEYKLGDRYMCKACNGRHLMSLGIKNGVVKGFIDPQRAQRLQRIRKRGMSGGSIQF